MKYFLVLSALVLVITTSCSQSPIEIYLSVDGDDSGDGTIENPAGSFTKAHELAKPYFGKRKVEFIFQDGTYYLSETVSLQGEISGTDKYQVTYRAANEGKAVLSGGKLLQLSWEPYENGIMKATVNEDISIDQLYVDGQRQRMARFPNAVDGLNVFDAWELIHTNEPDSENDPLDPDRIASWENPEGAYFHAMQRALWGDFHWLVKGKKKNGTLDMEGGWQNNRPTPFHNRYRMIENVFEELDAPGEWYFNKEEKILYFYPISGQDMTNAKIEVVKLKHLIEFNGTRDNPVKYVNLEGFVFRHAARSFMENKEPLLRSDWTTYRGGAVFINNSEDCSIINCEFDQVGGNSIFVNNYNRRINIKSCYIHHSGANGIAFVGDPETVRSPLFRYGKQNFNKIDRTPGPKGDNYPADCVVEDCLITMTGRDEKQTSPIQISMSHKIRVSHCSIYDVPRAGINISEGTFGGHIIEHCDVFNTVLETGDHGSFNSWGRDRFWTPDINVTAKEVAKQANLPYLDLLDSNIIRNSRWRCDHGWDIDLDDGSTWYRIYNNVLLSGGLKMREGYDRIATNNIIVNNSLHPHVWYPNSGDVFKHNIVFNAYRPAVMNRGIDKDGEWGKELDHNLFASNQDDKAKFAVNNCDANSIVGDPLFVDAANGDYRVNEGSPAFDIGFENFSMNEFGVVSAKLKAIAKQPDYPPLSVNKEGASGQIREWNGAKVKNVETLGEQSANGLSAISGVLFLDVPQDSEAADLGFMTSDVIVAHQGQNIINFTQLKEILSKHQKGESIVFQIMRNQEKTQVELVIN